MKGLILKDFMYTKSTLVTLVVMLSLPLSICVLAASLGTSMASGIMVIITVILCLMSMVTAMLFGSSDETCGLDCFAAALPVSRAKIVLARYCTNLLVMFISSFVIFAVQIICSVSTGMPITLIYNAVFVMFSLLISAITNPIVYKFSAQIGSYVITGMFFLLGICFTAISNKVIGNMSGSEIDTITENIPYNNALTFAAPVGVAVCAIIFALSILLSISIYKKKDF